MDITPILTVKNVAKQYGKGIYIEIEHLDIPKGFSVALIGENGAGKSSLLRLLSGIDRKILNSSEYSMGEIDYFNVEKDYENIQNNIGYVSSHNYFLQSWTLKSMGISNELLFDNFSKERYEALCNEWGLTDKKKRILTFSNGMKMKAALASVFSRDTKLLLLDEPTSPLDPLARSKFCDMIRTYIDEGQGERSVVFSTHNISDMENTTDYAIFMAGCKVVETGFVEDLKEKYILVKGVALTLTGIFVLLLTNHAAFGCLIMMAGFGIFAGCSCTMPLTESVAVSPRQHTFEMTIPNIITVLGTIFTYATLSIIAYLKTSPSSLFYEVKWVNGAINFYYKVIFAIMIMTILLAAIYKHFILNAIIAALIPLLAKVLYIVPFFLGTLLGAFPFVNEILGSQLEEETTLTTPLMIIWAIPAILLCITLSLILRKHMHNTPFAIFIKNSTDRAYKKAGRGNILFQNKFFLATCLTMILAITAVAIVFIIDYKKPDGWYDRSDLRAQYKELLEDCKDKATVGDFTFTLTKRYYDAVTGDGCCMFTVESNGKPDIWYNLIDHNLALKCSAYYDGGWNNYDCYLYLNGSGSINMEYELDKDNPDKAYVYVWLAKTISIRMITSIKKTYTPLVRIQILKKLYLPATMKKMT